MALGMLAAFVWLQLQGPPPGRMKLLASDLDGPSVQQLTAELDRRKIPYRLDGNSDLMVPDSQLATARGILTAKGLSGAGTKGYEIFDQGNSLTLTDFDQQVRLTRALEGEIERTLEQVRGISRARVHLVLPKREPFMRERQDAQASVMLSFPGRQTISPEAVQSVVTLVANAVPGLKPGNVTVVDSNLHLLAQAGNDNDPALQTAKADEERQRLEGRLSKEVELMLERSLGVGHVRAEASVRMNFDTVNETQEHFDPDTVVRSTQNVNSSSKTTDKSGAVSVQNNLPNADAGAQSTGSQEGRQEETTNYEISKTVRAVVHDQPQIERISLAVMVDGIDEVGPDGKHSWHPRDQAEIDRISRLVKTAVGYDEKRGDTVEVVSMPFINDAEAPEAPSGKAAPAGRNNDLLTFLQVVGFGVVGFGIIILTARSILTALNRPPSAIVAESGGPATPPHLMELAAAPGGASLTMIGQDRAAAGPGVAGNLPVPAEQATGSAQVAIRRATELADSNPDQALAIIRRWIGTE